MKIDKKLSEETSLKVKEALAKENKEEAIVEAMQIIAEANNEAVVNQVLAEAKAAESDAEYKKSLGLRTLNESEKAFYERLKNVRQSLTADQVDIIPETIIDRTLADVKKASNVLTIVKFTPANVKKWISASKTGTATWGAIDADVAGELTATITSLNIEVNKLTAYIVLPKAIADLALEYVDRYVMAILAEAMQDGLEKGFINGDGKVAPVGILRQLNVTNTDGTNKAKTKLATITGFTAKQLAGVRKTLTNNGLRTVSELFLICNPLDEAEYVDPALFMLLPVGGYGSVSPIKITKLVTANCPQGTGIFTIADAYTMGLTQTGVKRYDQTLAMDDADLIIAKAYANGRADDDNTAVPFDVTKLVEYVPSYKNVATS